MLAVLSALFTHDSSGCRASYTYARKQKSGYGILKAHCKLQYSERPTNSLNAHLITNYSEKLPARVC